MQLQPNTTFANRYQLERLLGRGGFSEVWLAKDNWTHLHIAIKVYAPGQGMDANGLQDFCGELANVFDLNHTNLLKPTHVDTWNDMPYLIMAYCSQGSLAGKIGKLSEEQIWKMIHDVASGLAYLHGRDVVHQDIKPDNILIDEFNNYVITDFGISTRARSTLRKSVVGGAASGGTTAYMGPERFSRQPAPTKASDIWSFGAMVYEVLEGNVPFGEVGGGLQKGGAEIPFITANVSEALKFTVYKMLSKETWDRPTAETLVAWSQNPQAIDVDSHLLNAEENPNNNKKVEDLFTTTSRQTQRFGSNSSPKEEWSAPHSVTVPADLLQKSTASANKSKKSKVWLWVLLALFALGTGVGVKVWHNMMEDQKQAQIYTLHNNALDEFNKCIQEADIDHIEALERAYGHLQTLQQTENEKLFMGSGIYPECRQTLLNKSQELYEEAGRRYQLAPSGSPAETRNKNKRRQIAEFKQKI
ncbi:MAG: serine/threonine protein kinase [Paludibacteraceae bacterium]|nr:serine/threonine protein kinase [Paludibacteraceae bacterium]